MSQPWEDYKQEAAPWDEKYGAEGESTKLRLSPQQNLVESIRRKSGLAGRAAIEGMADIPAMIANVPAYGINKLLEFGGLSYRFPEQRKALSDLLTLAGLPQANTSFERGLSDVLRSTASVAPFYKAGQALTQVASPVARRVGQALTAAPETQLVSAAAAGGAAGLARESGAGEGTQLAAGLLAGGLVGGGKDLTNLASRLPVVKQIKEIAQPFMGEKGRQTAAGRNLAEFLKNELDDIIPLLERAKQGETAAQAALQAQSPRLSALEQFARRLQSKEYLTGDEIEQLQRVEQLRNIAKSPIARREVIQDLQQEVVPIRTAALGSVDRNALALAEAKQRAAETAKTATSALRGGMAFPGRQQTIGGTVTPEKLVEREVLGQFTPAQGPKDTLTYTGIDRAIESASAGKDLNDIAQQAVVQRNVAQSIYNDLKGRIEPLTADSLIGKINDILQRADVKGNKFARDAMEATKQEVRKIANEDGTISGIAAHEFRKAGLNEVIRDLSKGVENVPKDQAAKHMATVRKLLDESIVGAGGKGWDDFLKQYSAGMTKLEQMTTAQQLGTKLSTRFERGMPELAQEKPASFLSELEKIKTTPTESGKTLYENLTKTQRLAVDDIERQIQRNLKIEELAGKGTTEAAHFMRREVTPQLTGPGLISAKISAYNWVMRALSGKGGELTDKTIGTLMRDPKLMASVIKASTPEMKKTIMSRIAIRMRTPTKYLAVPTAVERGYEIQEQE